MNTETNLQLVLDTASTLTEVEFPYTLAFIEWAAKCRTEQYSVKGEDGEALYKSLLSGDLIRTVIDWDVLAPIIVKSLRHPKWDGLGFGDRDFIHQKLDNFPFDYTNLQVSEVDPCKIAGVRKRLIGREAAKFINDTLEAQKNGEYVHWQHRFEEWEREILRDTVAYFLTKRVQSVDRSKMVKSQTVLKPVKILKTMYPHIDNDNLSVVGGYIADGLRERKQAIESTWELYLWDTPSEIYHTIHSPSLQSCMKAMDIDRDGNRVGNSFELYDDLPNTSILVCRDGRYVAGRALVHKKVENMDTGEVFGLMDRIYFANADILAAFKIWAKRHGYVRKLEQKLNEDNYVWPNDSVEYMPRLRLETHGIYEHDYEKVPYVDTFSHYYETEPEALYSYEDEEEDSDIHHTLNSTTGYDEKEFFTETSGRPCCSCGRGVPEDEAEYVDGDIYCQDCFDESYARCECGNIVDTDCSDAEYIDDVGWVCPSCLQANYTRCSVCGGYEHDNDIKDYWTADGKEGHICHECRKDESVCLCCDECGTYAHPKFTRDVNTGRYTRTWCKDCCKDGARYCTECEEWFDIEVCTQSDAGDWYCDNCYYDLFEREDEEEEEEDKMPEIWHRCTCKAGRKNCNGDELYSVCLQGAACWNACQERNDRLNEGTAQLEVWKIVGEGEVKCHWCGRPIQRDAQGYTNAMCDAGYLTAGEEVPYQRYYHRHCFDSMREIFPHRCEKCNKHFAVIYTVKDGKEVQEQVCFTCMDRYNLHEIKKPLSE